MNFDKESKSDFFFFNFFFFFFFFFGGGGGEGGVMAPSFAPNFYLNFLALPYNHFLIFFSNFS